MHITDWLGMLGEHFPLVVIGCAEALLAVVLLCAALRNRRQCADKNGAHSGGQKAFPSGRNTVRGTERSRSRPSFGQRTASGCRHRALTRLHSRRRITG
ncbi:MAG: hypothetical protein ACLT2F_10385 [Butyricicoccus sp.]